jgi:hypothetical protein
MSTPLSVNSRRASRTDLRWDWYAAYMDARQSGSSPDEASAAAGRYMAQAKGIVVAPDGGNDELEQ